MLKSTFIHIPGIAASTENYLWRNNILTWEDFIRNHDSVGISWEKKALILKYSQISEKMYNQGNYNFFSANLPQSYHWRAYNHFKACFLDIETTGLSREYHDITTIGVFDGNKSRIFIKGINLEEFSDEIKKYGIIITFNGRCFDLPFIQSKLDINFDQMHIDLRFLLKQLGLSGGLKRIEKEIGICRDDNLSEVDGLEAVRLWRRYEKGDKDALNTLIEYNRADIENLKTLMDFAYSRIKNRILPEGF